MWRRIIAKVVKDETLEENMDLKHSAMVKIPDGQTEEHYCAPGEQRKGKTVNKLTGFEICVTDQIIMSRLWSITFNEYFRGITVMPSGWGCEWEKDL